MDWLGKTHENRDLKLSSPPYVWVPTIDNSSKIQSQLAYNSISFMGMSIRRWWRTQWRTHPQSSCPKKYEDLGWKDIKTMRYGEEKNDM